ncbi:D-2-hydroxyacid dehydrogenase [Pseudolysinimonas kribbensis]|uniref:Hydroxyacid dehydrogenase n=1 Tax=Pseudolysinimonas kribbensis TaxID=433641 RepID=A0ABQ6K2N2_9MICO|nr:D-2-hydroxyacid dehydrogenase [Pseudolysinimonas kribbensis]GMA94718.1 hydroxyacid dehydrogenase [Pseudolysinimonas kribbensis]
MPAIHHVLATVDYSPAHREHLRRLFAPADVEFVSASDVAAIDRALERSDVAVLAGDVSDQIARAPGLRWIHCDHAGLNASARPEIIGRRDLVVTASAGRAAPALAQHAIFFALALTYDAPGLVEMKSRRLWRGLPGYEDRRGLMGKTMTVVGLGHTGREVVRLAGALGMRVIGYGRGAAQGQVAGLDEYVDAAAGGRLDEVLGRSDVVVLCVRLTDETYHLIGEQQLEAMRSTSYLINLARGSVVDEHALVAALRAGTIAGAGLDVFEREPLPADAEIWDAPNTIITPHVTAEMPDLVARSLAIIERNVDRYRAGEPLENAMAAGDLYTH